MRCFRIPGLLLLFLALPVAARAAMPNFSALDVFRDLPPTIFENTVEGLTDDEKRELLERGRSASWRLIQLDDDTLSVESAPLPGSEVRIQLFRGPGITVAAVGAESGGSVGLELWRVDASGRLTPYPMPDEPELRDFFAPGGKTPKGLKASMQFRLSGYVLRVTPIFTDASGPAEAAPDMLVYYRWNRSGFEKVILPLSDVKTKETP